MSLMAARGTIDYSTLAKQLRVNEGAARVAAHRLRKRFREIYREEISQTVADDADLEAEAAIVVARFVVRGQIAEDLGLLRRKIVVERAVHSVERVRHTRADIRRLRFENLGASGTTSTAAWLDPPTQVPTQKRTHRISSAKGWLGLVQISTIRQLH